MSTISTATERDPFLRLPAVLALVCLTSPTVYRLMQDGTFPRPVVLGRNMRAWLLSEIQAWQAECIAARDTGADAALRVVNPNIGKGRHRATDGRGPNAAQSPSPRGPA